MPLTIIHNDITKMHVDVIVNAANVNLKRRPILKPCWRSTKSKAG